ncbi:hypothetical protein VCR5J5_230152 [Vibrio crassostreae]|uniref:Uncharacterized protein n=1 Tax=Vibrio crassostreae TaxID=246167 RepID=A0A822N0T1_9VIBR|nr:hypothetical protein VCR5J5_230152 [Vibrio crassostreae]
MLLGGIVLYEAFGAAINKLLIIAADSELSVTRRIIMLSVEGQSIVTVNNQFSGGGDNRSLQQMPANHIAILISNGYMNVLMVRR